MSELRRLYSNVNPCPKCGCNRSSTKYIDSSYSNYKKYRDTMKRICSQCNFIWYEKPLDFYKEKKND